MSNINNDTPISHTSQYGTKFNSIGDLTTGVIVSHDWDNTEDQRCSDYGEFTAWHALQIRPHLISFAGYDTIDYYTEVKHKMQLVLGDWSHDGHGECDIMLYEVNHTLEEIQEAYINSCKSTKLSFEIGGNYAEHTDNDTCQSHTILCNYQEDKITGTCIDILRNFKCPYCDDMENNYIDEDSFSELWWWFISLSLTELEYTRIFNTTPRINGGNGVLGSVTFGYGLYYG